MHTLSGQIVDTLLVILLNEFHNIIVSFGLNAHIYSAISIKQKKLKRRKGRNANRAAFHTCTFSSDSTEKKILYGIYTSWIFKIVWKERKKMLRWTCRTCVYSLCNQRMCTPLFFFRHRLNYIVLTNEKLILYCSQICEFRLFCWFFFAPTPFLLLEKLIYLICASCTVQTLPRNLQIWFRNSMRVFSTQTADRALSETTKRKEYGVEKSLRLNVQCDREYLMNGKMWKSHQFNSASSAVGTVKYTRECCSNIYVNVIFLCSPACSLAHLCYTERRRWWAPSWKGCVVLAAASGTQYTMSGFLFKKKRECFQITHTKAHKIFAPVTRQPIFPSHSLSLSLCSLTFPFDCFSNDSVR